MRKLDNETLQLAFEDIKMICDNVQFDEEFSLYEEYLDKFDAIELALDELYERRGMMQKLNDACEPHIIEDEVYKKAEALEIISQLFDIKYFIEEWYKRGVLPQEDYELLKEVL